MAPTADPTAIRPGPRDLVVRFGPGLLAAIAVAAVARALASTVLPSVVSEVTVAILIIFFLRAYRNPKMVPTKAQWIAESAYGFVRNNIVVDMLRNIVPV